MIQQHTKAFLRIATIWLRQDCFSVCMRDAFQRPNFRCILSYNAVWEMCTPSIFRPTRPGRSHTILSWPGIGGNVDEGVLHTCIKFSTLRSIFRVPKWSDLNQIVDHQPLSRTTKPALGPQFTVLFGEHIFYDVVVSRGPAARTRNACDCQ